MTTPSLLRRLAGRAGAVALAGVLACGLPGCGDSSDPGPTCPALGGVWRVAIDYGHGLVAQQQWTLSQSGCDLTFSGDPPDPYGPLLNTGSGGASDEVLWARWVNLAGACLYTSGLEATLSGDSAFDGTLYWSRYAAGTGFCPGGSGSLAVQGRR